MKDAPKQLLTEENYPYLESLLRGEILPPFEVEIQVSSRCPLSCPWCIGHRLQEGKQLRCLANAITEQNADRLVENLLSCMINGRTIHSFMLSGLIGEPLSPSSAGVTLRIAKLLVEAGRRVGVFTSGLFMDEHVAENLQICDYVHVSLDVGPKAYGVKWPIDDDGYDRVLSGLAHLNQQRLLQESALKINVGYIMMPESLEEMKGAAQDVKRVGADSIRIKQDISGAYSLDNQQQKRAEDIIEDLRADLGGPDFAVHVIHPPKSDSREEQWDRKLGCYFHNLFGTVGSDGNVYLCDHCAFPGSAPLGNVLNDSFKKIWLGSQRRAISEKVSQFCVSKVCPPFGNHVNCYLESLSGEKVEVNEG